MKSKYIVTELKKCKNNLELAEVRNKKIKIMTYFLRFRQEYPNEEEWKDCLH